jgi:hypothetical protein
MRVGSEWWLVVREYGLATEGTEFTERARRLNHGGTEDTEKRNAE